MRDWWISTKKATFWAATTEGYVADAAPIARRFIGQPLSNLLTYFDFRYGGIEYEDMGYRKTGGSMPRGFRLVSRGEGDLKTRYRPRTLSEVVPTFPVKRVKKIVEDPNASQVYLFEGISGTGKTTCARVIARSAVCECEDKKAERPCLECSACKSMESSSDFTEINVANFRKIDDIRAITDSMRYVPYELQKRIFIFDEIHQLTPDSQQLLLKVLEEPPKDTLIFLCTTEKGGLKRTLVSRSLEIEFKRITRKQAERVIEQVLGDCSMLDACTDDLLSDMFNRADGSVRDLLNLLQAFVEGDYEIGRVAEDEVSPDVAALSKSLINKDWETAASILSSANVRKSPESFRIGVTNYLRAIALKKQNVRLSVATALGQLAGTLHGEPPIEQYNILVLRCMRSCYKKS